MHSLAAPLVCALVALQNGAQPAAQLVAQKPSLAMFTFKEEQGVSASLAKLISERVAQLARDSGAFSRMITSAELESLLGVEAQRQLLDCDSAGCAAELAGALNVDLLLTGTVGRVGNSYIIGARLIDVRRAAVVSSAGERVQNGTEEQVMTTRKTRSGNCWMAQGFPTR